MKYYAVIDTNVLVSAMLKWDSVPGNVLELAFSGVIVPLLNEASRCTPRISAPSYSSCQRRTACARSGGQVSSSHLPSCREAVLFFPFRSLLVHEQAGLAGFLDLSEKYFCRSYLAPFVSFGLTGRNETGRGAAAHAQAQAVKGTCLMGYEPQYIKNEPQLTSMSAARCYVIGIFFVVAWASAA